LPLLRVKLENGSRFFWLPDEALRAKISSADLPKKGLISRVDSRAEKASGAEKMSFVTFFLQE